MGSTMKLLVAILSIATAFAQGQRGTIEQGTGGQIPRYTVNGNTLGPSNLSQTPAGGVALPNVTGDSANPLAVFGDALSSFSAGQFAPYQINYRGSSTNFFGVAAVNFETSDSGGIGLAVNSGTSGGTGFPYGIFGSFYNFGPSNLGQVHAFGAQNYIFGSGNVGTEVGYRSFAPRLFSSGRLREHVGFDADDSTIGDNNNISYQSHQSAGAGRYAFYTIGPLAGGTAGIKLGSAQFSELPENESGTIMFCTDCRPISATDIHCGPGGGGTLAFRILGGWACFSLPGF